MVIAPGWGVRLEWERDDLIASAFTVLATVQQTDEFSWWHARDAKYHHCVREYEYTLRVGYPDRLPNFFRGRPSQSGHSGSTVVRETPEQACDNQNRRTHGLGDGQLVRGAHSGGIRLPVALPAAPGRRPRMVSWRPARHIQASVARG